MQIQTSRFGPIDVDDQRVIQVPKGLLGFTDAHEFVLLESTDDSSFFWLQSTRTPDLAFVVTDPVLFVPTYRVPLKPEQMTEMGIQTTDDAQVFVIVNKRGQTLTGTIVINVHTRQGEQLVLSDRRFNTRVPLLDLQPAQDPVHPQAATA